MLKVFWKLAIKVKVNKNFFLVSVFPKDFIGSLLKYSSVPDEYTDLINSDSISGTVYIFIYVRLQPDCPFQS